jgi:hypothetical protein
MKRITWFVAAALAIPAAAYADDQKPKRSNMTLNELPNAVKSTVQREAKGKDIVSIRKEGEDTRILYRIQLEKSQVSSDTSANNSPATITTLVVSQDGKVVSGGVGGANDHGNGVSGDKRHMKNSNENTDQGRMKDTDPDKGAKPSTDSLDKDHIRP